MKPCKIIYIVVFILMFFLVIAVYADSTNPLTGTYYGTATITLPASFTTIDLVFYFDVTDTSIVYDTSYIDTENTLLFPVVEPQIEGKDVGPRVSGTLSLYSFNLTTDKFQSTVNEKIVTRQITLTGENITNAGQSVTGTYTETVTGMIDEPLVISGTFILVKPEAFSGEAGLDLNADQWLSFEEIKVGGTDPNVVEYSDISYALHLFYNPLPDSKVGDPGTDPAGEQTIKDALSSYYDSYN